MRKIALGRLSIPASEYYLMTLAELFDAIDGHAQQEHQRFEWYLLGVRKQLAVALSAGGAKDVREEELIPLDIDKELKKNQPLVNIRIDDEQ